MARILINGLLLREQHSGVQYSIENLVQGLLQEDLRDYEIEILVSHFYQSPFPESNHLKIRRLNSNFDSRFHRVFFEHFLLGTYLKKHKFDIYHSPGYILPYFLGAKKVVTIHDLIALDFPELCQYETALYFRLTLPASIERADKIITVSNTVKNDILNRFPKISEDKISVIYPGVHARFHTVHNPSAITNIREIYNLPDEYFLFVGNLEPKKNVESIIGAFKKLKSDKALNHKLVIIGKLGWKYKSIMQSIENSRLKKEIMLLGYVNEVHLPTIYSLASMLVFPSLYEGFGIPVIEAMQCGCPVIVSDRGALPEISGDVAKQVNPYDLNDIAEAMYLIANNDALKQNMIRAGVEWVQRFSWQKSARETLKVYSNLL